MSDLGGGTGDHLLTMIKHWDRGRWDTRIISEAPLTSRLTPDVPVMCLRENNLLDRFPIAQLRRLWRISRYLKRDPVDLVHCYFYWSIIYGRMLKLRSKTLVLVENREDEGFSWNRHDYAWLRRTRSAPDRIICVSHAVRNVVIEREGVDPERVLVIHNGVTPVSNGDHERIALRRELGIGVDALVVGMVANLNRPIKGVRYFVEAMPLILQSVPSVRFVIFGRGKEEAALRNQARSVGVERALVFAGYRTDIERYYATMDLSVLTSLSEGLSISLLQSMNHGVPVVVTSVGGNPEVVINSGAGYLVPPLDVPAFAGRVIELLRDPDLRSRMGTAGRKRVQDEFQISRTAAQYDRVYDDVLNSR